MKLLAYSDTGNGDALVWLHPFPFSGAIYHRQREIEGVRHIVPDLRGFGGSELAAADHSIGAHATDVVQLLDHLGVENAVFGGVSMGGYVVMEILRQTRARVRGIVLADTRETADTDEARNSRVKLIERVEQEGSAALVDAMFPKMLAPDSYADAALTAAVRSLMLETPPSSAAAALRAMAARPDSTETLRDSDVPALILVGAEDAITPRTDAERMQRMMRRAQLHVIEDAGHLAMLERPEAFNEHVRKFVRDLQ